MAVSVGGRIVLDTNILIDYLRAGAHAELVAGHASRAVRFLSAVVLMELRLGADTPRRRRAVDRMVAAFPRDRVIAPTPALFSRAGELFRKLYGDGSGLVDRLGPIDDLLIALSAWQIGATVVTRNVAEFRRVAAHLPGLRVVSPDLAEFPR